MTNTNSRSNRLVDVEIYAALKDIDARLSALAIPFFIIGAVARDIISAKHGEASTRRTSDLDLAVMVKTEEEFIRSKKTLVESGKYRIDAKQEQRLHFNDAIKVDLVPFGQIQNESGKIALPPSRSFVMNVSGFQEAFDSSQVTDVGDGLNIRIATVEDLVVLKFIAWSDRPTERERDAEDISYIFKKYLQFAPEAENKLYESHRDILESNGHDIELSAVQLLAHQIKLRAKQSTLEVLRKIAGQEPHQTRFMSAMLTGKAHESYSADQARAMLVAFRRGLE